MAVFTLLDEEDIESIVGAYDIGSVIEFEGINAGIENSNFFLTTQHEQTDSHSVQEWVLTVFENLSDDDLPFFSELTSFLANHGFAVPAPILDKSANSIFKFKQKSGVIVPRFEGQSISQPSAADCKKVGAWLGKMHLQLRQFTLDRTLVRDHAWMIERFNKLSSKVSESDRKLLSVSIGRYQEKYQQLLSCPQGIVHGDLFKDNVLFEKNEISGVIDFYNASSATLIYDLAVAINDWATTDQGYYVDDLSSAMLSSYQSVRAWSASEKEIWPYMLELAALRFWISRLESLHLDGYQDEALEGNAHKDPSEMKRILENARRLQH